MDPVEDTLREVESLICGLYFEVAVGLDLIGRVLFWRIGDEDSVSPTPEELELTRLRGHLDTWDQESHKEAHYAPEVHPGVPARVPC